MQFAFTIILMIAAGLCGAAAMVWYNGWSWRSGRLSRAIDVKAGPQPISGSVAVLDIDDLAGLNSAAGFDTGDRLLDRMEDALRRALPKQYRLERLENGRFVVWLPEADLDDAAETVERLRATASTAYVAASNGIASRTLSAGLVATDADHDRGRAVLYADAAAARAKANGGNRMELVRDLTPPPAGPTAAEVEAAIAAEALSFHVQPIIDLRDGSTAGVEALLRWTRPDGEMIGPASFVDQLERMPDLSGEVMPKLIEGAARPILATSDDIFFTINITAAVLDGRDSAGCRWLAETLTRLPPDRIVVEIVETSIIAQPDRAADLVARLRAKKVRVALDDFGTGLSNLDRLRLLPVDFLKIDRAFIDNLGDGAREEVILRNMVRLASDLGMELIAEGIETAEQAETIKALGVRYAQGYYFGHPGPVSDWAQRLSPD